MRARTRLRLSLLVAVYVAALGAGARLRAEPTDSLAEARVKFRTASTKMDKESAALDLVRMHDPDSAPWDYLVRMASQTLDRDVPFPFGFDAAGKIIPRVWAPDFLAFCAERKLDPNQTGRDAMSTDPLDLAFLGRTADPRAFDVLERGLRARNYMLQAQAASGLGRLRDPRAVPLIAAAARKAPPEARPLIAKGLVFFEEPAVIALAEELIGDARYVAALRKLLHEHGPDALP